jgi:K+ channel tetramerisation domain./TLD.
MKNKTAARKSSCLSELEKQISKRRAQMHALDAHYESILRRKKAMLEHYERQDVKPTDIIQLNVGGRDVVASRETLTAVAGSRLEDLFSGKWENRLIRDEKGRVFLDLDSNVFEQVLEYLYHFKMGLGEEYLATHVGDTLFELYVDYFELRSAKKHGGLLKESGSEASGNEDNKGNEANDDDEDDVENEAKDFASGLFSDDISVWIQKEVENIRNYEKELGELEKGINQDDKLVSFFLKKQDMDDGKSGETATDAVSKPDANNDILYLLVQSTTIGVKKSTLCLDEESIIAQLFRDEAWIKEHSVYLDGRFHIIMEYPASSVVDMVNYLRCMSMNIPKVKVDRLMPRYLDKPFWKMIGYYFPNDYSPFSILNREQMGLLKDWLVTPGIIDLCDTPHLLYRASSDGWDFETYKTKCYKGDQSMLVVIKTVDGYVLGGYTNRKAGVSSVCPSRSHLFSLVNPAGHEPIKLHFWNKGLAFHPFRNLSSLCGPVFGGNNFLMMNTSSMSFGHNSNVSKGSQPLLRCQSHTIIDELDIPYQKGVKQWQSNIDIGDITSFYASDYWKGSLSPATVGVDLCVKVDGTGYAYIEHGYLLPEGLSKDFMTGNAEFEITDFEVYGVTLKGLLL